MADNVIACRCSSVIHPLLLLSPFHFQNSLSTFSIARVNLIPLWDFCASDFQRALKIIIIAELFIVLTISQGQLRHDNSDNAEKARSRSNVLKLGFHQTANVTTTTQKQSDYKVEQSSFTLIALF